MIQGVSCTTGEYDDQLKGAVPLLHDEVIAHVSGILHFDRAIYLHAHACTHT